MMEHELSNEEVKIAVSDHGAELTHLVKKATGEEYIWSGEDYWKRHSPVLFPFVGNVAEGYYSVKGKKYPMGQHGFARDMDFAFEGGADGLWFHFDYTEETLQKYPFRFHLRIGYTLSGKTVGVHWQVTTEDEAMPFMIGAHPAFNCPPVRPNPDGSLWESPFTERAAPWISIRMKILPRASGREAGGRRNEDAGPAGRADETRFPQL